MLASVTSTAARSRWPASGATLHSDAVSPMQTAVRTASHGLRRPPRSATAPSAGANSATARPAAAVAPPHHAVPTSGVGATARVT